MSDSLSARVWASDLDGELKPLAAALANCGSDDGTSIFPSIAYMAWKISKSERTVQRHLVILKKMGVISILRNSNGGRGMVPHYRLRADSLPKREPWMAPTTAFEKGDILSEEFEKGDTGDAERVTPEVEKGDIAMSPDKPLEEHQEERVVRAEPARPSATTCSKCGADGIHKCPGWVSDKQRNKRGGQRGRDRPAAPYRRQEQAQGVRFESPSERKQRGIDQAGEEALRRLREDADRRRAVQLQQNSVRVDTG